MVPVFSNNIVNQLRTDLVRLQQTYSAYAPTWVMDVLEDSIFELDEGIKNAHYES